MELCHISIGGAVDSSDEPRTPIPSHMKLISEPINAAQDEGSCIPNGECQPDAILELIKTSGLEAELRRFFLETPEAESLEDFVRQFCSHFL